MTPPEKAGFSGPLIVIISFSLTVIIALVAYFAINRVPSGNPSPPAAQPSATPTPVPSPTATPAYLQQPVELVTPDGVNLKGTYFSPTYATETAAPALLLLHMAYGNRDEWQAFAETAQRAGYAVLTIDLRGHGQSEGKLTFTPILDADVDMALGWLMAQPSIDAAKIGIAGASVGANLALRAGAAHPEVKSVALLSPGLTYWEIDTPDALAEYGPRPVLLVAAEQDKYAADSTQTLSAQAIGPQHFKQYSGTGHGTELFQSQPDLPALLLNWFNTTLSHQPASSNAAGPQLEQISSNAINYPGGQIPRYGKFELTFTAQTVAANPQWPYDAAPPPGIAPGQGITINALFSPDNWQTVYTQPAFYHQDFIYETRNGRDWLYPTDNFTWKIRFSPTLAGPWQYKLSAQDANGLTQTEPQTFTVAPSDQKGFVRVSPKDSRYFEFDNGELFLGTGYNLTFGELDWINPVTANAPLFQALHQNKLQLFRTWLSHWGIFPSAWNPWNAQKSELHAAYIPETGLTPEEADPRSEVSMKMDFSWNPCMFIGAWKAPPAVKRNTLYQIEIRYKTKGMGGPEVAGQPYGLVAKTGGWLWGEGNFCHQSGTGTVVTAYQSQNTADWQLLTGQLNSGETDFLPNFFLVIENATAGEAFIDSVKIQEDLGNGQLGPNIVSKPWMAQHLYFEQRNSYAFDQALELAEKYDLYFKLVILEKNEKILNQIDFEGNSIPDSPLCWDDTPANNPPKCPGNVWFYGNGRQMTKVRWLQQAWWRYLQARWGYSPHIHSWELLNEGDPESEAHFILADEFGKYMRQFTPNNHLVTTSFWHSFPTETFWKNRAYPNLDYADLHAYSPDNTDTAGDTDYYSRQFGAFEPAGANKPLVRGEAGFSDDVIRDTQGVWLHNYIWGGINAGGMYEQYWYGKEHIVQADKGIDLRYHYRAWNNFMASIPLNNGNYRNAEPDISDSNLRVWGQKDPVNGCAHLWIQNRNHTWRNVVDGKAIPPISGVVSIEGFAPGRAYQLEWWDTYQPDETRQITGVGTINADAKGTLTLAVKSLPTDVALKIKPVSSPPK